VTFLASFLTPIDEVKGRAEGRWAWGGREGVATFFSLNFFRPFLGPYGSATGSEEDGLAEGGLSE